MKSTTKVAITGTVLVMLAGVGVWVTYRGEEKPAAKVSDAKVERQMKANASAKKSVSKPTPKEENEQYSEQEIEEALAWLDSLGKGEDLSTEVTSEVVSDEGEETDVEEEKPDSSERTPEQQRRYEILAQLLPRYFELNELVHKIDSQYPFSDNAPDGLSDLERAHWYEQKFKTWEEEYTKPYTELRTIRTALLEHFPEAVKETALGDGRSQFSVDFRKLRELVGGRLPTDK